MKTSAAFAVTLSLLLTSCTSSFYIKAKKPAPVTISTTIQSLALVNRTKAANQKLNILEGVLTGEGVMQDPIAAVQALEGARVILSNSTRFTVTSTGAELKGSSSGVTFPVPLEWKEVESLGAKYKSDGLLVLELFDTDYSVTSAEKKVAYISKEGAAKDSMIYTATGKAAVTLGFRLYDVKGKTIAHEKKIVLTRSWSASAGSLSKAALQLINRRDAVNQIGYALGKQYAELIVPSWHQLQRNVYKKSRHSPSLEKGFRYAKVGDWNGAREAWRAADNSSHQKTAGKAAYNIAVSFEIDGELDSAAVWAQRSYIAHGNRRGSTYAKELRQRMNDIKMLEIQEQKPLQQPSERRTQI